MSKSRLAPAASEKVLTALVTAGPPGCEVLRFYVFRPTGECLSVSQRWAGAKEDTGLVPAGGWTDVTAAIPAASKADVYSVARAKAGHRPGDGK